MEEMTYNPKSMKTTKCKWCDAEIVQWKKEGKLFCEECREKYTNIITDALKQTAEYKESDQNTEEIKEYQEHFPLVQCNNGNRFGTISDKNTIINLFNFRGIKRFDVWINTEDLLNLIKHKSHYISKYIEHNLEASYYYKMSLGEYTLELNRQTLEQQKEMLKKLKPQYDSGELTLAELAKKVGMTKAMAQEFIEQN